MTMRAGRLPCLTGFPRPTRSRSRAAGKRLSSSVRRAGGGEDVIPSKMVTTLRKGDRLVIETAGGGGYGDPYERPGEQGREDVRNGKVSEEAARATAQGAGQA